MLNFLFGQTVNEDFVRFESTFPNPGPGGFITAEVMQLIKQSPTMATYTPQMTGRKGYPHKLGMNFSEFNENKRTLLTQFNEQNKEIFDRIKFLDRKTRLTANIGHTNFLSCAFILQPIFEKFKIPFSFTLYPGGGFGLNNEGSDRMLKDIFRSKYFSRVIVNNDVTQHYLIDQKLCNPNLIDFVFGVPLQFMPEDFNIEQKTFFGTTKNTFDVCFVAFNYDGNGYSKGYDLFLEAAELLLQHAPNSRFHFHVVGNYNRSTIPSNLTNEHLTFHGIRNKCWLVDFYHKMDIAIAPCRPNCLYQGSYDGWMCFEQSIFEIAMFEADAMNVNQDNKFYQADEFVKIRLDAKDIAKKLNFYYKNVDELYSLAKRGRKRTKIVCGFEERTKKILSAIDGARK